MSLQIDDATIERAETDVTKAYLTPITGGAEYDETTYKDALMNLTFLLLLRRNSHVTRSGAKTKTSLNSSNPSTFDVIRETASTCAMYLEALRQETGSTAEILDICQIYFKSNFISL